MSLFSIEISEGVVLNYCAEGVLVGMDIDNAKNKINLNELPLDSQKLSA